MVGSGSSPHPLLMSVRARGSHAFSPLMALLVHLRVGAVGRLGVTAVVTIGAAIGIAGGGGILCHAFGERGALCAVLRTRRVARGSRLVTDGGKLRVAGLLARDANGLSHLSVDRRLSTVLVAAALVGSTSAVFVSLALGLLLLLLGLPLFADLFELYNTQTLVPYIMHIKKRCQANKARVVGR